MEFKSFPKLSRLKDEYMYITEKLDGTNAQICIYEDENGARQMKVGSRTRWISPGKDTDNYGFAGWCEAHKQELIQLPLGRHYGEWWGNNIQRGYNQPTKRLSLFNQSLSAIKEIIPCIDFVPVLYEGPFNFNLDHIQNTMNELRMNGSAAAPGFMNPEGVVVYLKRAGIMFKLPFDEKHKGEQ